MRSHWAAIRSVCVLTALLPAFGGQRASATAIFDYGPIEDSISSAALVFDVAGLQANRTYLGYELNFARLYSLDPTREMVDLSDQMFGTDPFPIPPLVDLGPMQTAHIFADVPASFFDALTSGRVALEALLTDTGDQKFAIDTAMLQITTATRDVITATYGSPNDGFLHGIPDGGDLPSPVWEFLPVGSTHTGFDETISSKYIVPEPATAALLAAITLAAGVGRTRRR
jgi:hypothetical protein